MIVAGLDLSLACTGLVVVQDNGDSMVSRVKPQSKLKGLERLRWIVFALNQAAVSCDWIVVEGPSYGSQSNQQGHHERAGLWWMAANQLSQGNTQWIVVAPTSLKKYATGKGNAAKDQVLSAVIKRYREISIDDNNVADALVLAAMGRDALGRPLAQVPQINRDALAKVQWPTPYVSGDLQLDSTAG